MRTDTNGASRLSHEDKKTLIYGNLLRGIAVTMMQDVDEVLGVEQISGSEVLIFLRNGTKNFVQSLNANSGELTKKKELG